MLLKFEPEHPPGLLALAFLLGLKCWIKTSGEAAFSLRAWTGMNSLLSICGAENLTMSAYIMAFVCYMTTFIVFHRF